MDFVRVIRHAVVDIIILPAAVASSIAYRYSNGTVDDGTLESDVMKHFDNDPRPTDEQAGNMQLTVWTMRMMSVFTNCRYV